MLKSCGASLRSPRRRRRRASGVPGAGCLGASESPSEEEACTTMCDSRTCRGRSQGEVKGAGAPGALRRAGAAAGGSRPMRLLLHAIARAECMLRCLSDAKIEQMRLFCGGGMRLPPFVAEVE